MFRLERLRTVALSLATFAAAYPLTAPWVYTQSTAARDEGLLEAGAPAGARPGAAAPTPASIKIVSYNIRWRGGEDLRKLIELFRSDEEVGRATLLGLQEVDRNKKRTGNANTARLMAEELGMYYAWAAPPPPPPKEKKQQQETPEEETGVAILSVYPLSDVTRIVLPNEGPNGRRRAAIGATLRVGETTLRVYSVHAEIRSSNKERLEQFQAVLDDLSKNHPKVERAVVLGDFNTLTMKDVHETSKLFTGAQFTTPFSNNINTWKTLIIELKLDYVWLRGLTATSYGIDRKINLSDHWPLWVEVKL